MRSFRTLGPALLLGVLPLAAHAALKASPAAYRARLQQSAALAQACGAAAGACDAARVGDDLQVEPGGYAVHLGWLRSTLTAARAATTPVRARLMREAADRIEQERLFLDQPVLPAAQAQVRAQALAEGILNRREFHGVDRAPSWWQLLQARFWAWIDRVFAIAARAGAARPWIGIAVEWTLLIGALAGLLVYALRAMRHESTRVPLPWGPPLTDRSAAEPDWAALAQLAAQGGLWREAVHALYWAAIGRLAAQGRWHRAALRTPREYLRLLAAASPERHALAQMTQLLERTWYARMGAAEPDYAQAVALAAQLGVPQAGVERVNTGKPLDLRRGSR